MKLGILLAMVSSCFLQFSCLMNKLEDRETHVKLNLEATETAMTIYVTRGEQWTHEISGGPFRFNVLPQLAVWLERADGTFVQTLYITGGHYRTMNHAGKNEKGALFWQECFPAWASRAKIAGVALPDKERPYVDGVTSATPQSSFSLQTKMPAVAPTVGLFVEVNKSADYNQVYTQERTGWVGQPSVVYHVSIPAADRQPEYTLKPIGHGDPTATNQINGDLGGVDSALQIVSSIAVTFPGNP